MVSKASKDGTSQHERFLETARKLGCDEDEAAFDEKLKAVAGTKPNSKLSERQEEG